MQIVLIPISILVNITIYSNKTCVCTVNTYIQLYIYRLAPNVHSSALPQNIRTAHY